MAREDNGEALKEVIRTSMMVIVNERATHKAYTLLIKRSGQGSHAGLWEFPGGKREGDDKLPDTIIKEVQEETGISVPISRLHKMTLRQDVGKEQRVTDVNKQRNIRFVPFFYEITLESLPQVLLSEEHDDYLWLELPGVNYEDEFKTNTSVNLIRNLRGNGLKTAFLDNNNLVNSESINFTETAGRILLGYILLDADFDYTPQTNPVDPNNFKIDLLQEKFH